MPSLRLSLVASLGLAIATTTGSNARADDAPVSVYTPVQEGARHHAGTEVPEGHHVEHRVRSDLVAAGAGLFGVPYLVSAVVGASSEEPDMLVPVVGPFLQLSKLRGGIREVATLEGPATAFVLVFDSLLQAAGVVTLIVGLADQKEVLVADQHITLRAAPMKLGRDGTGLGLVGSF